VSSKTVETELEKLSGKNFSVFNLGQVGTHIYTNYIILRDIIRFDKIPRVAFIEVSIAGMNSNSIQKELALKYYCSQSDILRMVPHTNNIDEIYASLFGLFRNLENVVNIPDKFLFRKDFFQKIIDKIIMNLPSSLTKEIH